MDSNALREHLAALHQELSNTNQVDAASSSMLADLMHDIKRLIDAPKSTPEDPAAAALVSGPVDPVADQSLPDRLEEVAVQFEADHPTLAASSRRLIDLLGKVGL